MSDETYSREFPLQRPPDLDDYTDEQIADATDLMRLTRKAVAPNPIAQALYPPLTKTAPKSHHLTCTCRECR